MVVEIKQPKINKYKVPHLAAPKGSVGYLWQVAHAQLFHPLYKEQGAGTSCQKCLVKRLQEKTLLRKKPKTRKQCKLMKTPERC